MNLLILLLLVASPIFGVSQPPDANRRYARSVGEVSSAVDSIPSNGSVHVSSDSNTQLARRRSRFRRNSIDEFKESVKRMEMISHVVNGIALQQGLVKGEITSEALISELLNFGSTTPETIQKIDENKLKQLVTDIQGLSTDLNKKDADSADIERNEKRFLMYDSMLKSTKNVKSDFKVDAKAYFTAATTVGAKSFDFSIIEEMSAVLQSFKNIQNAGSSRTVLDDAFSSVFKRCGLINDFKQFDIFKPLQDASVLQNFDTIFGSLKNVHEAVKKFQDGVKAGAVYAKDDDEIVKKVSGHLKKLDDIAGSSKASLSSCRALEQVFVSHNSMSAGRKLTHTSGFSKGFNSLGAVSSDLENPWIKSVVQKQSESLQGALKALSMIKTKSEDVSKSLELEKADQQAFLNVVEQIEKLSRISRPFDKLIQNILSVKISVDPNSMKPANQNDLETLFTNADVLSKKMKSILKIVNVLSELQVKHSEDLKKIMAITKDTKSAIAKRQEIQNEEYFNNILKALESLKDEFGVFSNGDSVEALAKKVPDDSAQIQTYKDGLKTFFEKIDKLRGIQGIESLGDAVKTIQQFRADKAYSSLNIEKVSKKLPDVKEKLTNFKTFIDQMKKPNAQKSDPLLVEEVASNSLVIGSATRGLLDIQTALAIRDDLTNLGQSITAEIGKAKLEQKDKDNIGKLVDLSKMYTSLDQFKTSVKLPTSATFKEQSPIFAEIQKIKDFPNDLSGIVESAKKLVKKLSAKSQLKTHLNNVLPSLDSLDFSRHQAEFGKTDEALGAMDGFFLKYASKLAKTPAPVNVIAAKTPDQKPKEVTKTPSKPDESWGVGNYVLLVGAILGFLLLLGLIILCIVWSVRAKREHEAQKAHDLDIEGGEKEKLLEENKKAQEKNDVLASKNKENEEQREKDKKEKEDLQKENKEKQEELKEKEKKNEDLEKKNEQLQKDNEGLKKEIEEKDQKEKEEREINDKQRIVDEGADGFSKVLVANRPIVNRKDKKLRELPVLKIPGETLQILAFQRFYFNMKRYGQVKKQNPKEPAPKLSLRESIVDFLLFQHSSVCQNDSTAITASVKEVHHVLMRHVLTISQLNRVILKKDWGGYNFLPGNTIYYPNTLQLILIQGPQAKAQLANNKKKVSTIEMFWWMTKEKGVKKIVMLTQLIEKGDEKVSRYYPVGTKKNDSIKFENLKVTLKKDVKYEFGEELEIRTLEIKFKGEKSFEVVHYLYNSWRDNDVPNRSDVIIHLLKEVRTDPNPVVVHCSAGNGRTGVFAYIELFYQMLACSGTDQAYTFNQVYHELRAYRSNAIQDSPQYVFAVAVSFEYISEGRDEKEILKKVEEKYKENQWASFEALKTAFGQIVKNGIPKKVEKKTSHGTASSNNASNATGAPSTSNAHNTGQGASSASKVSAVGSSTPQLEVDNKESTVEKLATATASESTTNLAVKVPSTINHKAGPSKEASKEAKNN